MSIQFESTVIGEVRATQLSASPAVGASLLRFTLSWSLHPKRQHVYTVLGTYLIVSVGPESSNQFQFLGHGIPEIAWCDESREGMPLERPLMYQLLLQADQLLALEHLRGDSGGLSFKLELRGNATGPGGIRQIYETLHLSASVSDWIRILRESGAADTLLVGVSIPVNSRQASIAPAVELVRGAHALLLRGEYDAAVAQCRRALESLWAVGQVKTPAQAARRALSAAIDERKSMSKRDRRLALGEALINFTHPAHHVDADGAPEIFSRVDAALAVATTAALVSSFSVNACDPPTHNERERNRP